ncbi:MRN complex-interacting protein [Trematomus bernacchii]|uniref:MRN complex-interacting protein n=1 Tax=Trematomus bernacchii TaxID=40690 RepID=UPI00146BF15D|nr:MRN complex-interacting protein [Trematomus bernacchii]
MGQEFLVLRCFTCQSFQVQQVKKVNKWTCKLCGEKQSLLKEFGRGSGADCRRHVQKLNAMRGAKMEDQEQHTLSLWKQEGEEEPEEQVGRPQVSSWSKYLDTPEEAGPKEEDVLMDSQQLHVNSMIDRKRKRGGQEDRTPGQSSFRRRPSDPLTSEESLDPAGSLSVDWQVGGASSMISETPPPTRPLPLRPVSSMFDSGEDFSLDL